MTTYPWIRLIDTKTNAKEKQICRSVSIQKRALRLVLCPPEWKKGRFFLLFLFLPLIEFIFVMKITKTITLGLFQIIPTSKEGGGSAKS